MDRSEAKRLHREARAEQSKDGDALAEIQRRMTSRAKFISSLEELHPGIEGPAPTLNNLDLVARDLRPDLTLTGAEDGQPRGREAVRAVLLSDTDRWWSVKDVSDELVARRWLQDSSDPESAARQGLYRLEREDRKVLRRKDGRTLLFCYRKPPATADDGWRRLGSETKTWHATTKEGG